MESNSTFFLIHNLSSIDTKLQDEALASDEMMEVCGCSATGKTFFCIKMAALALVKREGLVIYVDTTNFMDADQFKNAIKKLIEGSTAEERERNVAECMEFLRIISVSDLEELTLFLAKLNSDLQKELLLTLPSILFIDSLSSLYVACPEKSQTPFAQIRDVCEHMKKLNKKHNVAVVYVNNSKDLGFEHYHQLKNSILEPVTSLADKQLYTTL